MDPETDEIAKLVSALKLIPHPTHMGWFREEYRSQLSVQRGEDKRGAISSILFLHNGAKLGEWRTLKSDEIFFWLRGSPLKVYVLSKTENCPSLTETTIGDALEEGGIAKYQCALPAGSIFTTEVIPNGHGYSLTACVVSPGWAPEDHFILPQSEVLSQYPEYADLINRFY